MSSTEFKTTCPWCGRENEVHTAGNTEGSPDEGDISLCWKCREPSVFLADGSLRKPTDEERAKILADPDVAGMMHAMRESYRPSEARDLFNRTRS